jgi:hypothetical protein
VIVRATAVLAPILAAALLAACGADTYPMHGGGPGASMYSPTALGDPVDCVVLFLQVRPGDRIELLSAEAVGLTDGATAEFFFSPPVISADGTHTVGQQLEPLVGAIATAPEATDGPGNSVGIVARITATKPGRYELTAVRIRYRLNCAPEQFEQVIDQTLTVCAGVPKPVVCIELVTP